MRYKTNLQNIYFGVISLRWDKGGGGGGGGGWSSYKFALMVSLATGSHSAPYWSSSPPWGTLERVLVGWSFLSVQESPQNFSTKGPGGCQSIVSGSLWRRNHRCIRQNSSFLSLQKSELDPDGNEEVKVWFSFPVWFQMWQDESFSAAEA